MTAPEATRQSWYALPAAEALAGIGSDPTEGLSSAAVTERRARFGPNEIAAEPAPSLFSVAARQLADPMNIMLVAVSVISFFIQQAPVGVMVAFLVVVNVVLSTQQEMKARAGVDALSKMQAPRARVVRDGTLVEIPAAELVPGDIVNVEAGDLVPADGRLLRTASLETQEAALTGESAPIPKDADELPTPDATLGDRTTMVFQNTTVTRGSGTFVVTATGMTTEMGAIASMLSAISPGKSPLQRELSGLTKILSIIAWSAVVIIVVLGLIRGEAWSSVLLLGISMAISAIPTGLPTFVQAMLARGASDLAAAKAVVKNLTDVETLGTTSAINSDKTGTLTMNQMTVRSLYYAGQWYSVEGEGYRKSGAIRHVAGTPDPDFTRLAYGLCLCSDATVSDDGVVVGDPTEAALIVLAAKIGADAEHTRRAYPRVAEVPFDSAYKFMATFHALPSGDGTELVELVKGGPDVILARCSGALAPDGSTTPMDLARADIESANDDLSRQGLRVLAFAVRRFPSGADATVLADPMAQVAELTFVGLVGIVDPLRPEAIEAVRAAHRAGIDVRMITGDHAVTAAAIGGELGLYPGTTTGPELAKLTDDELRSRIPDLHVFGRVTPQDKLRLARLMQERGDVVAMTGDAVNDAAALKQADVGVAMGSGSAVTQQAANMILTDDNFGTLVRAIQLGRSIYDKITCYVNFQMTQLLSLVLLFLVASIAGINNGVPLTPMMVLFINFFICIAPVVVIIGEDPAEDLMDRPPRDRTETISSPRAVGAWLRYGIALFAATLAALLLAPALDPGPDSLADPLTMAFVVMSLGTILSGLSLRRSPGSGLSAPILRAVKILALPTLLTIFSVELGFLQRLLSTESLTTWQWLTAIGLSLLVLLVIELDKLRLRGRQVAPVLDAEQTVAPARARR